MTNLNRHIGLIALTLYGIGDILGAGIYGLVGKAAGNLGNAAWMAFAASMLAASLTGLTYASLGSRYPKAAGASYITGRAFKNNFISYVIGLIVTASGITSMATACQVFAGYWSGAFGEVQAWIIIVTFALLLGLLVFWGIRESMWANSLSTLIEVSGLLFILLLGLSFLGDVDYTNAQTATNPTGAITIPLILSGALLTFYSFMGFEDVLNVSEEVKNPERTIPMALIMAVGFSSLIYIGISLVAVSVVPAGQLAESSQPLVDVAGRLAPWLPSKVFSFISMFAVANTALLNFLTTSRLLYGMSRQNLMPKFFGAVHTQRKTPYLSILFVLILLLGLALSGNVSTLARATSVLLLFCFTVMNIALVVLKKTRKSDKGRFEIPYIIPIMGAIVCATLLSFAQKEELLRAGAICLGIIVLYFVVRPKDVSFEN